MRHIYSAIVLLSFSALFSSFSSFANEQMFKTCVACHGNQGEGNEALNSPVIAGLDKKYLARQLTMFKSGLRGSHESDTWGQQMRASVSSLSDKDIESLSSYVSQLTAPKIISQLSGDAKKGKNIYNGNCGACHGAKGEGNTTLNAPRLINQHDQYLIRQINHFKSKLRGTSVDDTLGRQMAMMANTVANEKAVIDVITYLQQANK